MSIILYDWFSMTSKIDSPQSMISLLGLEDLQFVECHGFYGYKDRIYYDGISIHYNGRNDDMGILLEMSGQGCRTFETFSTHKSWEKLFDISMQKDYNPTRLDIAYDDKCALDDKPILDIKKIAREVKAQRYLSKMRSWEVIYSNKGTSVNIGSKKSDTYIRIYDKAMERGGLDEHWVRFELQLRRDRVKAFIINQSPIGIKFKGVLLNYIRFVVPNKNDENKSRWKTQKWYQDFIGDVEKISIYTKKDIDYNLNHIECYIMRQAGNSIYTYIACMGLEYFQTKLKKRPTQLNKKQEALILSYKQEHCQGMTEEKFEEFINGLYDDE